ncbi:CDGSH iron-sulfur domain-containing protein [Candidatus Endowatersipora endosymbiont of Watersipora subatra]|uniref:CDGSH iron-sulfur domain-containing protein n=1 Tax=Candidatus Endowatersipora endosymbiont of Watersipora subatra TaxID=3077946 RepID=UPI00312CB641
MKTKIHSIAGCIGFLIVLIFFLSTVYSELFGSYEDIVLVKSNILKGIFFLSATMIIAGGSGIRLGANRIDSKVITKKRRMPFIGANGLLILVPAAFYLEYKASSGSFDTKFYLVQGLELIAGLTNLVMMGLNIRDGLILTGRIPEKAHAKKSVSNGSSIEERDGGPLIVKGVSRLINEDGIPLDTKPIMALCRCGASKNQPYCDGSHNDIGFDSRCLNEYTSGSFQEYKGRNITVYYNRLLCSHAGECTKHLKPVFDTSRTPWIIPDNASRDKIIFIIMTCPSGALSYRLDTEAPRHEISKEKGISIDKDGPYRVVRIPLVSSSSIQGACSKKFVLCRCGISKNKPYCDGSHKERKG